MIEAEITCECPAIQLADIGLALTRGMVVYLVESRARVSKDLQRAARAKGVTVKYVQRYREQHPAAPVPPPAPVDVHSPQAGGSLDQEALAQKIAELVTSRVLDALNQALMAHRDDNFPDVLDRGAGVCAMNPAREGKSAIPDDIPVFIPSKIGRDDLHPVDVTVTAGEASSVLDAAVALKAARKGKGN